MAARMQGATCKTLGDRYGRSAEAIRQLIIRNTEGSNGRAPLPTRTARERQLPRGVLSPKQIQAVEDLVNLETPLSELLEAVAAHYARRAARCSVSVHPRDRAEWRARGGLEGKVVRRERNLSIRLMALEGISAPKIAERCGLTTRRVRQILDSKGRDCRAF